MAKVCINGEFFDFDTEHKPMSEMLALEKALGTTYGQWEDAMATGSARALAGYIWLVWRRNGREVEFADIESGAVEVDYAQFRIEGGAVEPDPTTSPAATGASTTTAASTSGRSQKS